jgi:tRNA (uracil-5-)-methyltransferase
MDRGIEDTGTTGLALIVVLSSRTTTSSSLSPCTSMRDAIFPPTSASSSLRAPHLLDAYYGAGPFALTLAPHFRQVARTGLSADLTRFATHNAAQRRRAQSHSVLEARRRSSVPLANLLLDFPPARMRMALVIDPPHTGRDGGMATVYLSRADHGLCEL